MALCASCTDYWYSKNSISATNITADMVIGTSLEDEMQEIIKGT